MEPSGQAETPLPGPAPSENSVYIPFIKLKEYAGEGGALCLEEMGGTHPVWARTDQKVLEVGMVGSWKSVGWGVAGATALEEVPPPSKSRANDQ